MEPEPEEAPRSWRTYFTGPNFLLTLSLICLIAARSVDQTLYYRMSFAYADYVWYLSTVVLPIAFLVISWPVVWYKMRFTDHITPEMKAFPKYKFAIMGLFDTLFNLLSTFPISHLGSDLSNVLSQSVLPINMVGSMIFLRTRYRKVHYVGAILVIYGVCVQLLPDFDNFSAQVFWIAMMVVSQIPAAASNVYKEIGLKGAELDIWYANAWIGVFQFLWGIATVWTVNIKAFMSPHAAVPWDKFFDYISNANDCFLGHVVKDISSGVEHTYCDKSPVKIFVFFIIFNITYNQLMLYTFAAGSSSLFVTASAVRLPLVALLCTSGFLAGDAKQSFTVYDGFALFILVMAIVLYYSEPEEIVTDSSSDTSSEEGLLDKADGHRRSRSHLGERTPMLTSPRIGQGRLHSLDKPHHRSVSRWSHRHASHATDAHGYMAMDAPDPSGRSKSTEGRRMSRSLSTGAKVAPSDSQV